MNVGPHPNNTLWFEYENFRRHPRYLTLSDAEKAIMERFSRDGFYLCKNALNDALVEQINCALDDWMVDNVAALVANKKPDGTYPRLIGLHEKVPELQALFSDAHALKLQELLFGRGSALFTSITFLQGSQQPLHRDIPVFRPSHDALYYRVWFALEDADADNGTLTGVRGGHRVAAADHEKSYRFYERFEAMPGQDPQQWRRYQEALQQCYADAGLREEVLALSKGDMLIWHPLFPHGGGPIADKKASRRSVVLHVTQLPR